MNMRGKCLIIGILSLCIILICCACTRVIDTPAEELRAHQWGLESKEKGTVSLRFEGDDAALRIENDAGDLNISGLCMLTEDRMTICDTVTSVNYTFYYRLHGDRIELRCENGTIVLEKL